MSSRFSHRAPAFVFAAAGLLALLANCGGDSPATTGEAKEGVCVAMEGAAAPDFLAQLKAAGMTLDNLVMHRTYLADRSYTLVNRAVRSEVLGGRETALTVVIAGIFDEAWLLEIEAVAAG